VPNPQSQQRQVIVLSSTNNPARVGAYVDTSRTRRNAQSVAPVSNIAAGSGSTTTGSVRPFYAEDQKTEIENDDAATENAAVVPPPQAPNKWARGTVNGRRVSRSPYANGGMIGQSVFQNQGDA
jgi:hypothetical protein